MNDKKYILDKLFHAYDKAEHDLIKIRDEEFPVGTRVKSRIDPDMEATVCDGSLYAHQINTEWGHMSWRYLDNIEQPKDK